MERLMTWVMLIFAGVRLWLAQAALAQGSHLGEADRAFIKTAAGSGQAEIQLGKLPAERADSSDVRDCAKRLEKDHTQVNRELLEILDTQRIDISRDMEPYQAAAELTKLRGTEFARAYLQHIVKAHEEAVAKFAAEAKERRHPALKAYAAKVLPSLQEHLQLTRDLAAQHE
jgi:putative membrane protein